MRKKLLTLAVATVAASSLLTGCGGSSSDDKKAASDENITAVSREDGSGTRGAFIELFGIEQKDKDGNKVDKTTSSVQITNSTSVMMTTVAENKAAIGYISLGSLNDTVKAVKIDGAEASVDTVKDGSYKIVRPFNIVTKDKLSKQAQDFENYIMSADGQKIIQDNGYIKADEKAPAYKSNGAKGKVVVGGSSMAGGSGKIGGTIIGGLIIGVLNNGLNLLNVNSFWQYVVKGVVILLAVFLDYFRNKGKK